ncbi:MAG: hypothetical protein GX117_09095 [Candidatus Hydrogenedentes bacterium]|nr:hypothetical protein [Candidatus Hydrogenedentota bacterium]
MIHVGSLTVHVPKFWEGTFSTQLFNHHERSELALLLSLMEMVIQGVSTRKVEKIAETPCGTSFSKNMVSALCANLDPIIAAFQNRHLSFRRAGCDLCEGSESGSCKVKGNTGRDGR